MSGWGLIMLVTLFGGLVGCNESKPASPQNATVTDSNIVVKDIPNERPAFKREYTVKLAHRGITMKVTLKTSYGSDRYDMGELTQSDGKWVLFDVKSPADKILDREILPEVSQYCQEILALDAAYVASRPNRFVDEAGDTWERTK